MNDFDRHEPGFHQLHRVSPHVYTYTTEFLFDGKFPLQNRGVVVHLPALEGGTLVLINPAELKSELAAQLQRLERETGATVRYLLSPGDWHYLFIGQYLPYFPQARAYVPPGRIPGKNPEYPFTLIDVAGDRPLPQLAPAIDAVLVHGLCDGQNAELPRYELVFHLPDAGAIVSGDVFYYLGVEKLQPAQRAIGMKARVLDFHFMKNKLVKDAAALQRSLEIVLQWSFDRFISLHGDPGNMMEEGAKADVGKILEWARSPA